MSDQNPSQQPKKKKKGKAQKLQARLPRGFVDRSPEDIRATDEMVGKIREVFERYGFDPVETPMFEYTDCLGKFLPDSDRPNEGVFSVEDDDDQWMSLRYDLTAPLARHVAENFNDIQLPYRTYRNGWVFRNEKPGPGRFRQFMQFDADTVGAPGVQADAEMCMMMADTMEALGIPRGDYLIRVNNRRLLEAAINMAVTGSGLDQAKRLDVFRSLDKLDRIGWEGVEQLLGKGRLDESGDLTIGLNLADKDIQFLIRLLKGLQELTSDNEQYEIGYREGFQVGFIEAVNTRTDLDYDQRVLALGQAAELSLVLDSIFSLVTICREAGYEIGQIKIDPTCVRGLEYYTGPVFEAELTFPVTNEKGQEVVFGSVGGGGRYDGLVKRFTGQDVPATGFSIGVSRLMTALKNLGKLNTADQIAPVLVTVMDKDVEALGSYQKMVQELRAANIRAEMYQGNPNKFGKQLQYADRRECPIAIIQGSDERDKGIVQIKDMIEGRKQAAAIESNEEWRETRPGQFEVKRDDLVAEVEKRLAEQKADRDG